MRTLVALCAVLIVTAGTGCGPEVDLSKTEGEVQALLDQYVDSVQREDLGAYGDLVAHDPSMVNFGAFGTPIVGWDALLQVMEGQNAGLDSIRIDQSDVFVHVLPSGGEAWATSLWRFRAKSGEIQLDLPVRCSWQIERRDGRWLVTHFHKSIAAG